MKMSGYRKLKRNLEPKLHPTWTLKGKEKARTICLMVLTKSV